MQYQQLNQKPDVLNEKSLSIPVYDIKLSQPEQFHPIIGKSITDSSALLNIFNQLEKIESGNVCWTIFLNTSNKVIGFIGSDNKEFPFSDDNEKVRYFTSISQTLCRGVAVLVKNPSYDFDDNNILSKINKLKEDLSYFSIVLLDFAIKGEGYGFVSIAETGKFEMGGSVFKKYPSLDNLKPDVLNEPYSIKDLKHIQIIKKEHFPNSNNVIEKSSDAHQILFDFWDKTKINLVEQMYVLFLNSKLKPIGLYHHTTGGISGTILDNVIIVAIATKIGAKKVVIAHNHPSGRVFPSDSDIKISNRLKKSLEIVKIELADSLILSPKPEDMYSLFEYGNLYENGGQLSSKERDKEIAATILKQLGGAYRLMSFTGANNFIAEKNGVSFRIKNRKVNYVKITLNSMDTYDIIFGRIYGVNFSIVKELHGIYNDQLIEVFEHNTGMYLRFKRGGAIQGEENAEMVMNQNLQIRHHTEELEEILKSGKDVPAWVVSKISRAADSMSDATHYLEGTPSKMGRGGDVRIVDISKLKTYVLTYIPIFNIKRAMQIKQKAVYAESEKDAIAQLPRTAKVISVIEAHARSPKNKEFGNKPNLPLNIPIDKPKGNEQANRLDKIFKLTQEIQSLESIVEYFEGEDLEYLQIQMEILQDNVELLQRTMDDGGQVAVNLENLLKKSPIEVYNSPYHIEIEIKYNKGGMNYFTGVNEYRGFYLHVTPVKISSVKENIYTKQYAAFSGYKQLVLIVNRFSEKMESQAIEHAKEYYQIMTDKVLHKIREEYPEASLTKAIEAPAPFPENEEVENEPNLPLNPPIDMPKGNQQDEADRLDEIFKLTQEIQSLESIVEYFQGEDLEYLQIQIEIMQDNVELLERMMDVSVEEKEEVEAGAFTQSQSQIAQNNINESKTNLKKYSVLFTKEFNPNKVMRTSVSEIEADSRAEAEIKIKKTYPKSKILSISLKGKENKFARGGRLRNRTIVVLDEGYGQIINDLYTEWNNITNQKEQEAWEARVNKTKFGTYGTVSIFDVLENFEFDRSRGGNSIMKTQFKNELRYAISKGQNNRLSQGGNVFVCPVGTEVQSLIFDKDFFSVDQSKNWAKKHGFEYTYVDEKINTFRIRQQEPSFFQKEGFRTIQFTEGVQAVIGCPKKKIKKNASKSEN